MSENTIEPEIVDRPSGLELRRPGVPVDLNDLAARRSEGVQIIQSRQLILETLRKAAIRVTSPADWVLYKAPDEAGGQIVGYLQDCGCDRLRDLYGIEIFDVSPAQKLSADDPNVFHYLVTGSGRCKLTGQILEVVEGGRSSADDVCKGKSGIELELLVRKSARANLDGNITRELVGLKSVPIDELDQAWEGTKKKTEQCRRGRGFGTASERLGANKETAPDVDPPTCPACQPPNTVKLKYREAKGNRGAFYGCPNYQKHPQQQVILDAAKWVAEQQQKKPAAPASSQPQASTSKPPTGDEVFGRRQPGEEG